MDRRISPKEDFPMVIDIFKNRSETNIQHGKIFVSLSIPVNFDFVSL
jgi:hypothetical protein